MAKSHKGYGHHSGHMGLTHEEHGKMKPMAHEHHGVLPRHEMDFKGERPIHGEANPSHDKGEKVVGISHHTHHHGHQVNKHYAPEAVNEAGEE